MDFIINNYIWIIVISIILVMALIGYLAEKTDFIHENKQKKKEHKKIVEKEEKQEEVEDTKTEIPVTPLVSPVAEVNSTADSLGFEDPFAMSKDTVSAEKIEEPQLENDSNAEMDVKPVSNVADDTKVEESLFAPVEKPKFGESFSIPTEDIQKDEKKETVDKEDNQLEPLEPLESLDEETKNGEEKKTTEETSSSPIVEEINDSDIYGASNPSQEEVTTSEEDQIAAPKLNEEATDEMDEWKI